MPMRIGDQRPSFEGATEWLNELEQTADDYVNGPPTLVCEVAASSVSLGGEVRRR